MSRPSRPPSGDIPRNLSYIAGLYERAYYRTARPSLEEQEEEAEAAAGGSCTVSVPQPPRRWRSRSAPALRVTRGERRRSPETRKRVRFADSLGLELESVRHFRREDMPCVPLSVTHRLQTEAMRQVVGSCISREQPSWCEARHVLSPSWLSEPGTLGKQVWERGAWDEQTWDQRVCLQSMRCESCFLWGTVRVLDLAYEKRVTVRYTMDGWQSHHDTHALYAARLCHGGAGHPGTDLFTFRLPLPPRDQHQAPSLLFAIRYQVGEEEFWDNNGGKNYSLSLCKAEPPPLVQEAGNGWIHFI
ncbi:protein phosphatase 1 regulatory subunit 3E [Spea bombifrons]|uniref:protein phosphatase 1 regulatory subunit 3E n=1 Tax=Spea bombifrons TaxID=233779 RepID=UPI002349E20F|nr:protein phosphatase 1 regulatory subunit 3E [Spea bombifrons]